MSEIVLRVARRAVFGVVCMLLAVPASAALVYSVANPFHLNGATIAVTFQTAGSTGPVVIAGILNSATASTADFNFSVGGSNTFGAFWSVTNTRSGDFITNILFDLTGSVSLFDNNSTPSTPNSETGLAGVIRVSGPTPSSSGELIGSLWPDGDNLGDMFLQEQIVFANNTFGNTTFQFLNDTDTWVPEPGTFLLMGGGLLALGLWRRRAVRSRSS